MKENDKPDCCENGIKFVWWHINTLPEWHFPDHFTGWGMMVDYFIKDRIIEDRIIKQIFYCPFCGKQLGEEKTE